MNLADAIRSAALKAEEALKPQSVIPFQTALHATAAVSTRERSEPELLETKMFNPEQFENGTRTEVFDGGTTAPKIEAEVRPVKTKRSESMKSNDKVNTAPVANPEEAGPAASTPGNSTMVRLELFLGPEQLHSLLRAMVHTQHSVMTLREAASYLRIAPTRLETLANDRLLPAFLIDGKWRFSKAGLDEWLSMQSGSADSTLMESEG